MSNFLYIAGIMAVAVGASILFNRIVRPIAASRRIGAALSTELGVEMNLLMTALEKGLPLYTAVLQQIELHGTPIDEAADNLLPAIQRGLVDLHRQFGEQPRLTDAWNKIQERADRKRLFDRTEDGSSSMFLG